MSQEAAFKLVEAGARKQTDKYLPPAELPQTDDPRTPQYGKVSILQRDEEEFWTGKELTAVPISFDTAYRVVETPPLPLDDYEENFVLPN